MIDVHRGLQIVTALLAMIGALFLSLGRDGQLLPIVAIVGAIAALIFTDLLGWLRLNRVLANIGAIGAVLWSLQDFFDQNQSDLQLQAIGEMLIYLQFVLLFQEKNRRLYWQLLVLSVLQAVVASAMNLGAVFGGLLVVYFLLAVFQMLLLCVQREAAPNEQEASAVPVASGWRFLTAPPRAAPSAIARRALGRNFRWSWYVPQALGLLLATAGFSALFFFASPRHGEGAWSGQRAPFSPVTGFSSEVRLTGRGTLQPSKRIVLRAKFTHAETRAYYPLLDDPYFQGMVFNQYVVTDDEFRWIPHSRDSGRRFVRPDPPRPGELIRQDIVLEPTRSPTLFFVNPLHVLELSSPRDARWHPRAGQLWRLNADEFSGREYRYSFGTAAFRSSRQLPATPHYHRVDNEFDEQDLWLETEQLASCDAVRFLRVKQFADETLAAPELANASQVRKLIALQDALKFGSDFSYSLDLGDGPPPGVDPIEHFVATRKKGHCELFASALVMMLRTQNIPARLVTGYKGGEYNAVGHYFVVREKHAHAWVEAYLSPADTPAELHAGPRTPAGSWFRLDPTPFAANDQLAEKTLVERMDDAVDYVEILWRDYVLGFDAARQRETAFDAVARPAGIEIPDWLDARRSQAELQSTASRFLGDWGNAPGRGGAFPTLALMLICGSLLLVALVARTRIPWRGLWRLLPRVGRGEESAAQALGPQLLHRLQRQLARLGITRRPGQTVGELLAAAQTRLSAYDAIVAGGSAAPLGETVAWIVFTYERIRFGGHTLSSEECQRLDQALSRLAAVPPRHA